MTKRETCGCAMIGPKGLQRLMQKYLGIEPGGLTNDEREILLMALYMESAEHGGLAKAALDVGDARVAEAKAKLDAIIAAEGQA